MVDVVVVGAGHNGLSAAVRLAERGLDVLVVDKLPWPGGMAGSRPLAGVEAGVGAYVAGIMPRELREKLGISIEVPDPIAVFEKDGEYVRWWRDPERRAEEFERWGLGDGVEAFQRELEALNEAMRRYFFGDPPTEEEIEADEAAAELVKATVRSVLSRYLPREFWPMFVYERLLDQPAYLLAYFNPPEGWGHPVAGGDKGIHALGKALYRRAMAAGARVLLGVEVVKVKIEGGRARGVVLDDGKTVEAKAVLSTASPIHTLLDLAGPEHLPDDAVKRLRGAAGVAAGPYKVNAVLAERPKLREGLEPYRDSILQLPIGEAVVRGNYVTLVGEPDLEALESYVLNLGKLKALEIWSPRDYERIFNAPGAYVNHLPLTREYLFCRPACGWGYRTPIWGLYIGGAGAWPGGQITGVPGWNAAGRILEDLAKGPS